MLLFFVLPLFTIHSLVKSRVLPLPVFTPTTSPTAVEPVGDELLLRMPPGPGVRHVPGEAVDGQHQDVPEQGRLLHHGQIGRPDRSSRRHRQALEDDLAPDRGSRGLEDLVVGGFEVFQRAALLLRQRVDARGDGLDGQLEHRVAGGRGHRPGGELQVQPEAAGALLVVHAVVFDAHDHGGPLAQVFWDPFPEGLDGGHVDVGVDAAVRLQDEVAEHVRVEDGHGQVGV